MSTRVTMPKGFAPSSSAARSHAMKNCVSVIYALCHLGERESSDLSRSRWKLVKSQAQRLHSLLVEHLASDATLAVDEPDVPLSPCSVAEFLESVVGPLRARAEVADVHLTIDCGGGTIQADERALGEAIFNLVANAIEATPRGGHVTLETRVLTTGEQRWVVRDTGAGLPVSQLVHFGRGGRSTKIGGSGLGVALSRAAVDRHGGRLEVESQDALGTTVTISLGRANGHDQTAAG